MIEKLDRDLVSIFRTGIGIARIVREAEDRENWRRFCREATADRLNDLTV